MPKVHKQLRQQSTRLDFLLPLSDGARWRWWHIPLLPISIPFAIVWGTIGMIHLILGMGFFLIRTVPSMFEEPDERIEARRQEEFHLCEATKAAGRFIPWASLAPRLVAAEGTLIIEHWIDDPKRPRIRLWWTDEDVAALAPIAPPPPDDLDVYGDDLPHSFVIWCHGRLLHPDKGKAFLTDLSRRFWKKMKAGEDYADFVRRRFPRLKVVETALIRHLCYCGYDLRATPNRCPECGRVVAPRDENAAV